MTDTEKQIRQIIADQLLNDVSLLSDETTLESLGADSLDYSDILAELEDEFDISLNITEFSSSHTIKEIVNTIEAKL